MRRSCIALLISMFFLISGVAEGAPADPKLPVLGGKPALATVNGEPLTLDEFVSVLASLHAGVADNSSRPRTNLPELLERLIKAKLILQEARNIGLDSLPETKAAVKNFREETLRGMLYGDRLRTIKKADRKAVDKLYKDYVREVKVKSVLMEKEEIGKRLEAEIKAGGGFDEAAKRLLDAGEVKGSLEGKYVKFESLSPDVAAAVSSLKIGEVSPPVRVGKQFSLVKLEDVRFAEDPAARERAEKDALQAKKLAVLKKYTEELKKKHARVNVKVLDSLDYEAKEPGFDALLEDRRVVAEMKGENPVTVADLTSAVQKKFFHGTERAAEKRKINRRKQDVLDDILARRAAIREAKRKRLDRTEYFKTKTAEYENEVLFSSFVRKAIDPDVKVEETEIKAYLAEHAGEYATPEMMRIDGIAFDRKEDAENALDKLRKGADFQWTKENAEGRAVAAKRGDLLELGSTFILPKLPEGMRKAVSGAAGGEFRIYTEDGGAAYVLFVREVFPSRPKPYESVSDDVRDRLILEKRQKILRDWEDKLWKASKVKLFAGGEKLDLIVKPHAR